MKEISKRALVVIDVQNDFINDSHESKRIVPNIANLINEWDENGRIFVTLDTHYENENHCIYNEFGWKMNEGVYDALSHRPPHLTQYFIKNTFGSLKLINDMSLCIWNNINSSEEIHICGLYTDTNVVANALLIRAQFPDLKIFIHSDCCAGTSKNAHDASLLIMKQNNIEIIKEN